MVKGKAKETNSPYRPKGVFFDTDKKAFMKVKFTHGGGMVQKTWNENGVRQTFEKKHSFLPRLEKTLIKYDKQGKKAEKKLTYKS